MSQPPDHFDLVVVGAGPAGQKAAVQGRKAGKRVLLIERAARAGGECVRRGTIPSKALRQQAMDAVAFKRKMGNISLPTRGTGEISLTNHLREAAKISAAHVDTAEKQLARNGIDRAHGLARFIDAHTVEIVDVTGAARRVH
ncbi:MAG TPA: FAD-dependent oxidoreductase, partial [Myxococcota bacterium]